MSDAPKSGLGDLSKLGQMMAREAETRLDEWINPVTMGSSYVTRRRSVFCAQRDISDDELEDLFTHDDLAARIVGDIVDERMRQGILLAGDPEGALAAAVDRFGAVEKVGEAWTWGRLYGGGAVFLGIAGADPSQPMRESEIRPGSLQFLLVLDKRELTPATWVRDFTDPRFGEPETYLLTLASSGGALATPVIHASRLIVFGGASTTRRRKVARQSWDDSVLQRCWHILRDVSENWQSAVHLMKNVSQWVYKVKNLAGMVAAGEREKLQDLMEMTDMRRSVFRGLMIDAEHEDVASIGTQNITAIPDMLHQTWLRLAAAAGMPLTRLMGMSPAGLNATGESDLANWYSNVESQGERIALPALRRLVRIIAISEAIPGIDPDEVDVTFPSLWQLDPKETAELRKLVAETDALYVQSGVLLANDVALSRFGKGEWSAETEIDQDFRAEYKKAEEEALRESVEMRGEVDPGPEADDEDAPEVASPEAAQADPAPVDEVEDVQATALNGAQVTSLIGIVDKVAKRELPRDSGIEIMLAAFPALSREQAETAMGDVGRTFFASTPTDVGAPE